MMAKNTRTHLARQRFVKGTIQVWLRIIGGAAVFGIVVFCFIWQTIQYTELKTQRAHLRALLAHARDENSVLITEVAQLSAPERVIELARDTLALEPIEPEQIVIVNKVKFIIISTSTNNRIPDN